MFSEDGKLFVHNNKDNIRPLSTDEIDNFYKIFKETGSRSPSTYTDVTFNSSYILAAISYLKEQAILEISYVIKNPHILSGFFIDLV